MRAALPERQHQALYGLECGCGRGDVDGKIWKVNGMQLKDQNGNFIIADIPAFVPIYSYLQTHNIPVAAHLAEPNNCWFPLEEKPVASDRHYSPKNPVYHMYLHPHEHTYQDQL